MIRYGVDYTDFTGYLLHNWRIAGSAQNWPYLGDSAFVHDEWMDRMWMARPVERSRMPTQRMRTIPVRVKPRVAGVRRQTRSLKAVSG